MPDPLKITLSYDGPSAVDGTMAVSDVLSALQGFSGAYGKISSRLTPNTEHRLRVSAVEKSSFDVLLISIAFLGLQPNQQQLVELAVGAGKRVVSAIIWLIGAKKHIKGKPYSINVEGDNNNVVLINADNAKFDIPRELLEIFQDKIVDADLQRITSPLRRNEIDSAKITADDVEGEITVEISQSDKEYFESVSTETATTSKGIQVEGYLVSLNKERNRGTFRLQDGTSVPYEYQGPDPYQFHGEFARRGSIRVTGDTEFDQNLRPSRIIINSVEHLQPQLPFHLKQ